MAAQHRTRTINPRLGTYFAIFASGFSAIALVGLMGEQLGISDPAVRGLMFAGPALAYLGIGLVLRTQATHDFFAAGRRVPPAFNGLVLSICALGGIGIATVTGLLFHVGYDALCLTLGWTGGLVVMAVLFAPFLRKCGTYTLPSYLARRFESRLLAVVAAAILVVPILLILAAELSLAGSLGEMLTGLSRPAMVLAIATLATLAIAAGGMRSATWAGVAQAIAALIALAIPVTIVAVLISNMPLPQMTHGNMLRTLARLELAKGVPTVLAPALLFDLPGPGLEPLVKRFLQAFGSVGSVSFVTTMLTTLAGIAAAPWLLPRTGVTTGVYDSRNAIGWAVTITGAICLTLPAVAIYLRGLMVEQVVGATGGPLPLWFQTLQQLGLADVDAKARTITLAAITFRRDAALYALPIAAGFPMTLAYVALAGALAASLAAISNAIMAFGMILSEDAIGSAHGGPLPDARRVFKARLGLAVAAIAGSWIALLPADPLKLALYALAFSAASAFPVLMLSVLWKRMTLAGALAAMAGGLGAAVIAALVAELGLADLAPPLAGAIGMAVAFVAGLGVSLAVPAPGRHILEYVRDMRVPGGETLYDREQRIARRGQPRNG